MQNAAKNKSKRILSVRTPIVQYEKTDGMTSKETQASDIKDILRQVNFETSLPKQLKTCEKLENSQIGKSSSGRQDRSFDSSINLKGKGSGQGLNCNQHFIELRTRKTRSESPKEMNNKGNCFQEVLNRIASRIKKLRSGKLMRNQLNTHTLQNPLMNMTRKRFRSVNASRNRGHNIINN